MQKLRADSVLGRAGQLFTPLGGYAARDHAPTSYQYLNQGRVPSSSIQSEELRVYPQPPPRGPTPRAWQSHLQPTTARPTPKGKGVRDNASNVWDSRLYFERLSCWAVHARLGMWKAQCSTTNEV